MRTLLLILLASPALAATDPLPAGEQQVNINFREVDAAMKDQDLTEGGTIDGQVTITSSNTTQGDSLVQGDLTVNGTSTLTGSVTAASDLTVTGTIFNPSIPTAYGIFVTSDAAATPIELSWPFVNITSVTKNSTGRYVVTFTTPFATTDYAFFANEELTDSHCHKIEAVTRVRHAFIICLNGGGGVKDVGRLQMLFYGALDP